MKGGLVYLLKKKLDETQILIVLVCDNKEQLDNQLALLRSANLFTPQGLTLTAYPIIGRKNLAASFNEVQKKSNAKFKFYLTAPVIKVDEHFIDKTIDSFYFEPKTGMVGLMGSEMPISGDYTQAKNFYGLYTYKDENNEIQNYLGKDPLYYKSVHIIESGFFATNEDIRWDEKIGDDFLLVAQCLNYRSKGYDVGVLYQEEPLMIFEKDSFDYLPKADEENYKKQLENFSTFYRKKFQPLVSILIPTYNQPQFCQEALVSALSQTYQNVEILVGDDSTNEDTKKMIKPFLKRHQNLKYFYHDGKIPRGGGANMSFLLNHCSGEYVNYLLHDDLFHPEKIYKMMQYFIADLENEIGLISSARALIDENTQFIKRRNPWQPRSDTMIKGNEVGRRLLFILANFIGELTTVLFKKKDVELENVLPGANKFAIGDFCGVYSRSYGDMDTWLEILKSDKSLVFMTEALSFFRQHAAQNTYNPNTRITLPLDALNFVTVAWLNDKFFKDVEDFYYCLDKWPILAERWFKPVAEDDEEVIKKRKEWIIKLEKIFATHDRAKMTDAAISYLLECVPQYGLTKHLIRKNENLLWEKNIYEFVKLKDFDEIQNGWIMVGNALISKKNAKFAKALQLSTGNYIFTNQVVFGGEDFTIDFWGFMDSACPPNGIFFAANANNSWSDCLFLNRYESTEDLRFAVFDSTSKLINQDTMIVSNIDSINTLHHYEIVYSHSLQNVKIFVDGKLKHENNSIIIEKRIRMVWIGNVILSNTHFPCSGAISEFRISNCIRHSCNFTPSTKKYETDENTISLLHFD